MVLSCPLPEEQNTRGRKIHPPEESPTGFGILLTKKIPKVIKIKVSQKMIEKNQIVMTHIVTVAGLPVSNFYEMRRSNRELEIMRSGIELDR